MVRNIRRGDIYYITGAYGTGSEQTGERPSMALCEQIVTVCKSRLERYMGSVTVAEMRRIDRALSASLGIQHKAGGNSMKVSINTPFGEMNFDMSQEKVSDLIQKAMQYAAGRPEQQEKPLSAPQVAQEVLQPAT